MERMVTHAHGRVDLPARRRLLVSSSLPFWLGARFAAPVDLEVGPVMDADLPDW